MKRLLTFSLVFVASVSSASGATGQSPPIAGYSPLIPYGNTLLPAHVKSISCQGIGKPRAAVYPAFRCTVAWYVGYTQKGTITVWARLRGSGRPCASSFGLAACAKVPLPGDPYACGSPNADLCADQAAITAATPQLQPGPWSVGCILAAPLMYSCKRNDASVTDVATVIFKQGAARWTTTVAIG